MNKAFHLPFKTLKLILPALIPSWRFFDVIAPSPRIEVCYLRNAQDHEMDWHIFNPKPEHLSPAVLLKRLVFNPQGNEDLYLVSLAERIALGDCDHSKQEIAWRICQASRPNAAQSHFKFRLIFITREEQRLEKHILWTSDPYSLLPTEDK